MKRQLLTLVLVLVSSLRLIAQNGGVSTTQSFTYTGRIEPFMVPAGVTSLTIEARGAEGIAGRNSGRGAILRGVVAVSPAQTLSVLVGGQPTGSGGLGGGGGSFVVTTLNNTLQPLLIAGGGGGGGNLSTDSPAKHGQAGQAAGAATNAGGAGGSAGNGGRAGTGQFAAAGGGGLLTDGQSGGPYPGGQAFVNGGRGGGQGQSNLNGGFGGGGAGVVVINNSVSLAGGGGGGYSGGGGASANSDGSGGGYGGGGGSYNLDSNGMALTGAMNGNLGNGLVTITYVPPCPALTVTRQPASASTVCAGSPVSTFVMTNDSVTTYQWYRGGVLLTSQTSATLTLPSAQLGDAGSYSVVISSSCTSATSTAFTLTVNLQPPTPTLLTKQGQSYPGGQSSVTVDVNTPSVVLEVGNCNGTISWTGSNGSAGNTNIIVPTNRVGRVVYQVTCTVNGCTSFPASATVTVQAQLTVLHRDVDNYADNNAVQPLLQIQNRGAGALPYSALTLRYYLTVEGNSPLSNLFVNDAQVGGQNVRLRYVSLVSVSPGANIALPQPAPARQGATGYVEVSFAEGAGSLAPGGNSGNLRLYFAKADYSSLDETDDYSYAQVRDQLVNNPRITAYYNGSLVAGTEPVEVAARTQVQALTESKNGPSATQINTYLVIRNTGNVAIPLSQFRVRYYFTSDNNQPARVELDEGEAAVRIIKLPAPVGGADSYVEVRYTGAGLLQPGASTGRVRYRVLRSDDGRFDQTNDYSYQERPEQLSVNNRVTVLADNRLIFGTPPNGAPARTGASATSEEPGSVLSVRVLGNPVSDAQLQVEITGAQGQPLRLSVSDVSGRLVSERQVEAAGVVERQSLNVSRSAAGLLLLQVSTPTQSQTVKVLKAQ